MRRGKMEVARILLKIIMWVLILGFGCNFVMQTISYAFYKNAKIKSDVTVTPEKLKLTENLSGYGANLNFDSDSIILFFGGSGYIAYNSVGTFAGAYDCPFLSADYYGTQDSKGKMNRKTMQKTAVDLYDYAASKYPKRKIIVMGHSYGNGMAAYLASARRCDALILISAYRDLSDLYNKMTPIFWGPLKVFISNNINIKEYARNVSCKTYVIGSASDETLSDKLQKKVADCFKDSELTIYDGIHHEEYLKKEEVIKQVKDIIKEH